MTNLTPVFKEIQNEDFKKGFISAAEWLDGQIIETEQGIYWKQPGSDEVFVDLYSGSAGVTLFYLELAKYHGDGRYDETIKKAGDYLIHYIENEDLAAQKPGIAGLNFKKGQWAYNACVTGIAHILIEITQHTGDDKYAETARYVTDSLLEEAEKTDDGHIISGESGILADGGNILYLIYASKYFENQDYLDLAVSLADHITAHAEVVDEQTIKFHPLNQDYIVDYLDLDPSKEYEWPNFEYGTAGVGFVLAKLYQVTGDAKYLTAAEKAANYIDSIAVKNKSGEGILIPYRLPDLSNLFYLGYCHGPAGTARLYEALYEITEEDHYKDQALSLARGVIEAEAPHVHSDGYWHIFTQCCGTASFIELFLTIDKQADSDIFKEKAFESGVKILSEANQVEEGVNWAQHWDRISVTDYSIDIGYFDGAAGIASALLHLYTSLQGEIVKIPMVDDTTFEI